jgi:hypothetical protein
MIPMVFYFGIMSLNHALLQVDSWSPTAWDFLSRHVLSLATSKDRVFVPKQEEPGWKQKAKAIMQSAMQRRQ